MVVSRETTQAKLKVQIEAASRHKPSQHYTAADRYEEWAEKLPDHTALIWQGRKISYSELNASANQVAHLVLAKGLGRGDVAALIMENRPEFFFTWLGLAKAGVTIALINYQISGTALAHAIKTTGCKAVFAGSECLTHLTSISDFKFGLPIYVIQDGEHLVDVDIAQDIITDITQELSTHANSNPSEEIRLGLTAGDNLFFMFTSGTTGFPKAARMSHMRWLNTGEGMSALEGITKDDVFYCFLPLFHGAALQSLTSTAAAQGATILLRRKFSASNFVPDVRTHGVTAFQYVGEVCRYLMTIEMIEPVTTLRVAVGAGLGVDIWEPFQSRFKIDQIFEGWGATEANCGITNVDNKVGAVGRIPFKEMSNVRLVRYDIDTDQHIRNPDGTLIECEINETGEAIAMILDLLDSGAGHFEGYTDHEATEAKILRNVFQEGDAWFRSGDLLRRDANDYYYFIDRVGDTFRWKSENVSTQEVGTVLADFPDTLMVNCYGVKVPKHEGRAGMAALVLSDPSKFNPKEFYSFAMDRLPEYAVPLFLRLSPEPQLTATFKLRKVDLKRQGYSAELVSDPLYVRDNKAETFHPLSDATLEGVGLLPFQPDE